MRDAVAETGLRFEDIGERRAVELGCLSAVQRLHRGGRLSDQEYLWYAAARSGQLEELKLLRAVGWPWDSLTCGAAAKGGHLELPRWARANGCPWNGVTCAAAASGGHLKVLQWARANGCPCDEQTSRRAHTRRVGGTSRCYSGGTRTAARVTRRSCFMPPKTATRRWCGRWSRPARTSTSRGIPA